MSKWLKKLLFGFWGVLLVPLIAPVLKKWLEENVFSDLTTRSRPLFATRPPRPFSAISWLLANSTGSSLRGLPDRNPRRRLTGMAEPEVGREKSRRASQPRLEVSQPCREHQDQDGGRWDGRHARDLKPAMLSLFGSARKFDLWAPNEHAYQLPDAPFLCEYLKSVAKHLEDGDFDDARKEALSWRPFLDQAPRA